MRRENDSTTRRPALSTSRTREVEHQLADIARRTQLAWTAYAEGLKGLEGKEYEDTETKSWSRLQTKLKDLETRRSNVLMRTSTGTR